MNRSIVLLAILMVLCGISFAKSHRVHPLETITLPPAAAVGIRLDTLLLGGYASGTFDELLTRVSGALAADERALVALHLDRIFGTVLPGGRLPGTGRLRLVYERAVRPDGTTRSVRVLAVEVAVSGRVHTAYYFEAGGRPGYYDPMGRTLDTGGWTAPLGSLRVNSPFGLQRLHPILNRVLPHTGVDFAARAGDPVMATADGVVTSAGEQGGYGLLIEIRHPDGYSTRYAHLSGVAEDVRERGVVRGGQLIGYVGQSGQATGPHLHYEVRKRGQPVDPMALSRTLSPASSVVADSRWAVERGQVGSLLARAPVLARTRNPAQAGF